ncbi:unnamed protein product, partial [Ceratitis capitata]
MKLTQPASFLLLPPAVLRFNLSSKKPASARRVTEVLTYEYTTRKSIQACDR